MDDVAVYHVSAAGRRSATARWRWVFGAMTAALAAFAFGLPALSADSVPASSWVIAVVVVAVFALFAARGVARVGARLLSYQLTLGPNVARIVCEGLEPAEIVRHEVTRVVENARGLRISFAGRVAGVPRELGGYDEVRRRLAAWRAIEPSRLGHLTLAILAAQTAIAIGSLVATLSPAALTASMALFVAGPVALAAITWRSMLDKRQRAQLYAATLMSIVWAAARVYLAWTG